MKKTSLLALAGLLLALPSAYGTTLLPGDSVDGSGGTFTFAATALDTVGGSGTFWDATHTYHLDYAYQESVYATSTLCGGCMDFVISVSNTIGSNDDLAQLAAGAFAGFMTNIGTGTINGGTGEIYSPSSINRTANGTTINFDFTGRGNNVIPGEGTAYLVIETNAPTYTFGTVTIEDDGSSGPLPGLAPAVPEPMSMGLIGGGLALLGFIGSRRYAKN